MDQSRIKQAPCLKPYRRIITVMIACWLIMCMTGCSVIVDYSPSPVIRTDTDKNPVKSQRFDQEGLDIPEYLEDAFVCREESLSIHDDASACRTARFFWERLLTGSMTPLKYEYITMLCLYSTGSESHFKRAFLLDILGYDDLAAIEYSEAIRMAPDNDRYYNNRGNISMLRGYPYLAVPDFTRAIEINPNKAEPYYNRGRALEKIGKYEDARRDYERAVELGICRIYPSLKICR